MSQRLGLLALILAIFVVGCRRENPRRVNLDPGPKEVTNTEVGLGGGTRDTGVVPAPRKEDPVQTEFALDVAKPTAQQLYEQSLLDAVDHLAERKYKEALAALEKAKEYQNTDAVGREIDKVRAVLEQEANADRAIADVKTVLDDGKAEEAAKLAATALSQYGGGDKADDLSRLKTEAEAVVTAEVNNVAVRRTSLKTEADDALRDNNLRGAVISLEQAVALGEDAALERQLADVRTKLTTYDENRARAIELRRDPSTVERALTRLHAAKAAWPTLQVQQEIDECQLILERRRDRLSVADLEVLDDVGKDNAGRIIAGELLPFFRPRFDLVERAQIGRLLNELNLEVNELSDSPRGRQSLHEMARLRYLVVGSLSSLGGVTLQARLVEVPTGLVVQTARVTAPTIEALVPRLRDVALMLQMDDAQKLAYQARLQNTFIAVKAVDPAPLVNLPPPPPPPAPKVLPPPPIVTYNPRPVPVGNFVIEDMRPQPVILAPQPLTVVLPQEDPRRHRLFRLSIELGDNCYRRGLFRDAQRHFSLAFSIGGPRREVALRLDACRNFVPPPPPPPVVVVQQPAPVFQPSLILPVPARRPVLPPPVVVTRPPVVIVRPRVAVFGFVPSRPTLVPPAETELLADQFASYCRGSYDIIDRGEVCWYMGRLNLTLADVLRDPVSRRCLAQALHARYFVFGSILETASFNVETQLVDAETGARTGAGKIHVQNTQELKLRMSELARQMGAKPDEQEALAKKGAGSEKALTEARGLLAKDPGKAAVVARGALKDNPDSTALQALVVEADRRARVAQVEAERRQQAEAQAKANAAARVRQQELAKQAEKVKAAAEAAAAARDAEARKQQQMQRANAAEALRNQAKQAQAKGNHALAVQQLQSAAKLQPSDVIFRELAAATVAADKAASEKAANDQKQREEALKKQQAEAAQRVLAEKQARDKVDADRRKAEEARQQALYDNFTRQAKDLMAKKEYAKAVAAAEAARRIRNTAESLQLMNDARHALDVEKASAEEKAKLEAARKKREEDERKLQANRTAYLAAMKKGQDALVAKQYPEAVKEFQSAEKLFSTEVAKTNLKTARDLLEQEAKHNAEEKRQKEEAARHATELKAKIEEGKRLRDQKQFAKAAEAYRQAVRLAPSNVEALAGMKEAELETNRDIARRNVVTRNVSTGKASMVAKKYDEAAKAFKAALTLDPDNAEANKLYAEAERLARVVVVDPKVKERQEAYRKALDQGRLDVKGRQYPAALKAFDAALAAMPADATATRERAEAVKLRDTAYDAAMRRATQAVGAKKLAEAEKAYDEALTIKPGDAAAIKGKKEASLPPPVDPKKVAYQKALTQAKALLAQKKYAEALKACEEALAAMPGDAAATKERADVVKQRDTAYEEDMRRASQALAAKKFADAVKAFDEALQVKPGDAAAIKGKKDAVDLEKKASLPPPVDPKKVAYQKALTQAKALLAQKKYEEALKAVNEALVAVPGDAAATKERADVVKQRDTAYEAAMRRATQAMAGKKYAEGEKAYDEALQIKPGDAAAIKGKKDAVPPPVDPKKVAYQKALTQAKTLLAQKSYAAALKACDEALAAMPGDAAATKERADVVKQRDTAYEAAIRRGMQALTAKKFAEAEKAFDEALQIKPGDAAAIKGKKDAVELAKKPAGKPTAADREREEDYQLAMSAGRGAMKQKNYPGAMNSFTEALKKKPGDAAATKELAEAIKGRDGVFAAALKKGEDAVKAKKYADAIKAFDEALKLKPGDAAAIKGKKEATELDKKK